jgi:hypothetical protein
MNELLIFLSQYPVSLKVFVYGGLLSPLALVLFKMIKEI